MPRLLPMLCCALTLLILVACQAGPNYLDATSVGAWEDSSSARPASVNTAEAPRGRFDQEPLAEASLQSKGPGVDPGAGGEADAGADPGDVGSPYRPQIVYTAELGLRVDRVESAQQRAERVVAEHGGYISASRSGSLVARVPAAAFHRAFEELATLGEVTGKDIQAMDVTDQIVDLESRLTNARTIRDRLMALIERADDMEQALEIERELARVTEQIELIDGRLRLAKSQVAYSTINLSFTPTPEQQRLSTGVRIQWVREMGEVFTQRERIDITSPRRLRDGVSIDLPAGFVRYYQECRVTQAVNADGVRIRVRRLKNFEDCEAAFWGQLAARSLREVGEMEVTDEDEVGIYNDKVARRVQAQRQIAGETVRYLAGIAVSDEYVYVFEAWGVAEGFERVSQELDQSLGTMRSYESFLN